MTIQELLQQAYKEISHLDAEVLLAYALKKERTYVLIYLQANVSKEEALLFESYVEARKQGKPVAYIIESKEFYGREFYVNDSVLIPRPETEELIDLLKAKIQNQGLNIVDVGTGSGCVGITLACEGFKNVFVSDVSQDALNVCKKNVKKHNVNIISKEGSLLDPFQNDHIDVVISNLPYIPQKMEQNMMKDVVKYEPHLALFGGEKGFELYEKLIEQIIQKKEIQYCFFEIDDCYAEELLNILKERAHSFQWTLHDDLSHKQRFLVGEKIKVVSGK